MKFEALNIAGAYKITPKKLGDNRGAFARVYCAESFEANGLNTNWVQMNTSISTETGTVRGLHYQRPPFAEIKLVRCVRGKVFDVFTDIREGSPTFGKTCSVILDSDALEMAYIPMGCAHGFQTLTDHVEMHYMHSEFYKPDLEAGLKLDDPELGIKWPLAFASISERDKTHPPLKTTEPIKL